MNLNISNLKKMKTITKLDNSAPLLFEEEKKDYIFLNQVSMSYEQNLTNLITLDKLSLKVRENEFVTLLGPSGCGKTTILKLIGGLLENRSNISLTGDIHIKGLQSNLARLKQEIGFIFQNPVLLPWRTVIENVALPCEIIGTSKRKFENPEYLLELMGLLPFKNYYPSELSGGMKQRVAIARALIYKPSILLMDEPFAALDESTREELNLELLRIIKETNATVLFVTHSISEAVFLSDRVVVLSQRPCKAIAELNISLDLPKEIKIKDTLEFIMHTKYLREQLEKATEYHKK